VRIDGTRKKKAIVARRVHLMAQLKVSRDRRAKQGAKATTNVDWNSGPALPFAAGSEYGQAVSIAQSSRSCKGAAGLRSRPILSRAVLALLAFAAALSIAMSGSGCGGERAAGSVGAVLGRDNDSHALYVRDVAEGLGADEAGVLPGDEIVMIDGLYTRDLDRKAITSRLRGGVGDPVELTILRGNEVHRVRVKRTPLREREEVKPKEEAIEP
jgi:S1-C subfamily serine protease